MLKSKIALQKSFVLCTKQMIIQRVHNVIIYLRVN